MKINKYINKYICQYILITGEIIFKFLNEEILKMKKDKLWRKT